MGSRNGDMGERTITVAFLRSADPEVNALINGLQRFSCEVLPVSTVAEITSLAEVRGTLFDGVIVPLRLASGGAGVTASLQVRADEVLTTTPIVALSNTREIAVLRALYGGGADTVIIGPFEPEAIVLQVEALCRQKRAFDEQIAMTAQSSGLKRSVFEAFNAVREGVLVFSTDGELTFLNDPARRLLGVEPFTPPREATPLAEQFSAVLGPHLAEAHTHADRLTESRATIVRSDGRSIRLGLRVKTVLGADETPAGVAIALADLTQLAHLAHMVEQDHRTRSLALLTAAGSFKVLTDRGGQSHSIIPQLETILAGAPGSCPFGATITALLELIDPALTPGARVKVNLETDGIVAIPAADLFQLAGHLILHSVARAGVGGETTVGATLTNERLELQVISELSSQVVSHGGDLLSRLVHGSWSERASRRSVDGVTLADFDAARGIAQKNHLALKERPLEGARIAYVVAIPLTGVSSS